MPLSRYVEARMIAPEREKTLSKGRTAPSGLPASYCELPMLRMLAADEVGLKRGADQGASAVELRESVRESGGESSYRFRRPIASVR
jgi:hypothetical protein